MAESQEPVPDSPVADSPATEIPVPESSVPEGSVAEGDISAPAEESSEAAAEAAVDEVAVAESGSDGEGGEESQVSWDALSVSLPQFEGPLDLLLHLVRSQGLDILDIPIVQIARQYNEYLDAMRRLDLEIASEYLVLAATLAHIKSRMMLPPDPMEEEEVDPRQELVDQLLEHEKYKRAAEALGELDSSRDLIFTRSGPAPAEFAGCVTMEIDLDQLVTAFERVLSRLEQEDLNQVIRREDFKIQDMMERIVGRMASGRALRFSDLLDECRNRLERIVLFLALPELVRLGTVSAHQEVARGEIDIGRAEPRAAPGIDAPMPNGMDAASGSAGTAEGEVAADAPESETAAEEPSEDGAAPEGDGAASGDSEGAPGASVPPEETSR